jgi:sugar O-acyltransferase (sialic acid O-acetyltransferase NeuD family)
MIRSEIFVPLLNANEPEARLVGIHVKEGQMVKKGEIIFTIETTKATADIQATESGSIRILASEGATLPVGARLGVITDTSDEVLPAQEASATGVKSGDIPSMRITKPAQALAEALGVDLQSLPTDRLITEDVVRQAAGSSQEIRLPVSQKPYILIYGAGGHAKSVMEMVQQNGLHAIAGILDDDPALAGQEVLGIRVLGSRSLLPSLAAKGVTLAANGVGGILDINIRVRVFELMEKAGFSFPVIVHPRATVEPSARLEEGVQVFANAYVGSQAELHARCMVNTNSVVSHDCVVGAYSHIAPGALLAGHVHVGKRTLVGMGVTTSIGIQIGAGVRIGNGAILLADVPDGSIIQAGRFWTGKARD